MSTPMRRLARAAARRAGVAARRVERAAVAPLHVLVYHRIAEPACDPWDLAVSADAFDAQLRVLRSSGAVVALADELERGRRGALTRRPRFAVTFDDGYVDNLRAALPVLERHDVPATIFVPTAFIGAPSFWWDRLAQLVFDSPASVGQLAAGFGAGGFDVGDRQWEHGDAHRLHAALHDQITWLGPAQIDSLLDRVVAALGMAPSELDGRPMTVDELRQLAAHPLVTIGAHTAHHRLLTRLDPADVRAELETGTRHLDDVLGGDRRVLAYPHGDANRTTAAIARRAGFGHALTTADRPVSMLDGRRRLPRRHAVERDPADFATWLRTG